MKRYISILLLAAFCFLLSGCSSNQQTETEQTEGISETVEVERPEEMPDMCQIGKMEFALPTNCTYYGEAEVEGSETIYLYMGDYQVVVSSDPFPHDISLTDMDEAALELYIGSLSEGSYQIAGCQAAVVGKYPYLLLAYHDEALETDYSVYHTIIDGQVYTFVGYREGDEPVSEQEQEFLYEMVSTMTEAPEEDEA